MFARKSTGLVREASLFDAFVWNSAASWFLGLAIFAIWDLSWLPGGGFFQAEVIAVLFAIAIGVSYAILTSAMPRAGGDYVFNSRILHPAIGFGANFSLSVWELITAAFVVYFISFSGFGPGVQVLGYLTGNVDVARAGLALSQPLNAFIIGSVLNISFTIVSLVGLRRVVKLLDGIWLIALIGVIALIAVLLQTNQAQFTIRFNDFVRASTGYLATTNDPYSQVVSEASKLGFRLAPRSLVGPEIAVVSGSVIWVFWSTYIAGEIKRIDNLKKNSLSVICAAVLNALLFLLIVYGMFTAFGYDFLASLSFLTSARPGGLPLGSPAGIMILLSGLASNALWLAAIIAIAFSIRAFLFLPSLVFQPVRCMLAWSMDRIIPARISEVSDRFHVPAFLHLLVAAVIQVVLILLTLYPQYLFPIFSSIIIAPAFSSIFPTAVAAALFPYRLKHTYENSPARFSVKGVPLVTITGLASAGFMLFLVYEFLAWPGFGLRDPFFIFLNFGLIPVGMVIYAIAATIRKRQGIPLTAVFREIPPE